MDDAARDRRDFPTGIKRMRGRRSPGAVSCWRLPPGSSLIADRPMQSACGGRLPAARSIVFVPAVLGRRRGSSCTSRRAGLRRRSFVGPILILDFITRIVNPAPQVFSDGHAGASSRPLLGYYGLALWIFNALPAEPARGCLSYLGADDHLIRCRLCGVTSARLRLAFPVTISSAS